MQMLQAEELQAFGLHILHVSHIFVKWWFHTFFIFSIDKRPRFRSPGWDPHVLTFAVLPWPQQVQAERERWDEEKEAALAAPRLFSAAECVVWMSRLWKPMWRT